MYRSSTYKLLVRKFKVKSTSNSFLLYELHLPKKRVVHVLLAQIALSCISYQIKLLRLSLYGERETKIREFLRNIYNAFFYQGSMNPFCYLTLRRFRKFSQKINTKYKKKKKKKQCISVLIKENVITFQCWILKLNICKL